MLVQTVFKYNCAKMLDALIECKQSLQLYKPSSVIYSNYGNYAKNPDPAKKLFITAYENDLIIKNDQNKAYYNCLKIIEHPVMDICPEHKTSLPIVDLILSNVYSEVESQEGLRAHLDAAITKSDILADVLSVAAIASTKRAMFIEVINNMKEHNPTQASSSGYLHHFPNRMVISKQPNEGISILIHEATHKLAMIVSKNDCNPYFDLEGKKSFIMAEKAFLNKINNIFMKHSYNSSTFSEENSNFEIGKELHKLSGEYINADVDRRRADIDRISIENDRVKKIYQFLLGSLEKDKEKVKSFIINYNNLNDLEEGVVSLVKELKSKGGGYSTHFTFSRFYSAII